MCGLFRDTRACWTVVALLVITYLAIMDIVLYSHFRRSNLVQTSKKGSADREIYSPFTHLSVKTLLLDEPSQFLKTPSAEYFNAITHISALYPVITPNVISVTHLICAFLAGKFIASPVLNDRRIGVCFFCFRSWLDALDGVVFRAQANLRLQFRSHPATSGYFIDAGFDALGGFFLCFGVLYYLIKRFGPRQYNLIPLWRGRRSTSPCNGHSSSSSSGGSGGGGGGTSLACSLEKNGVVAVGGGCSMNGGSPTSSKTQEVLRDLNETVGLLGDEVHYSVSYLFSKGLTLGLLLALAGMGWNYAMQGLTDVFHVELSDENLSLLQFEHCHSTLALAVFMGWRLLGSMSLLNYVMLVIFFDKIWEFLQSPHLILLALNASLLALTHLYVRHLKGILHLS